MPEINMVLGGKFLRFKVGGEEFGVNIGSIIEIIRTQHITEVPHKINYIKGVINLRGKVIPVIDARLKLGIDEIAYGELTCIIVIKAAGELIGLIVDAVDEVIDLNDDEIGNHEMISGSANGRFISGIGKAGNRMTLLLNVGEFLKE